MTGYDAWLGRSETLHDVVDADRVAGLLALLDDDRPLPAVLPPLGHWLFARSHAGQSALGRDGHPARGGSGLLPPVALPRRMWAGSDVEFMAPIPLGARLVRHSTVAAIEEKVGRSGRLVFVTVDHDVSADGVPAVREGQHLVFRDGGGSGAGPAEAREALASRTIVPDSVQLFRYSALTFNAHRIHYDRDYAGNEEGYPALVVQGPYAATLMLSHHLAVHPGWSPSRFSFRARAPLFDDRPFTVCSAGDALWIVDAAGRTAMTGSVTGGGPPAA